MAWTKSLWEGLSYGWWFHAYSRWDVRRQAERDGKLNPPVPAANDAVAPWYLGAMKEHFDNIVRGILGTLQKSDQEHRTRIGELEREKTAAAEELKRRDEVYAKACDHFKTYYPDIPPRSVKNQVAGYLLITAFLFLLEWPMNFSAFKLFGDHANALTAATSACVGGALLVLAHFLGIAWEKGPLKDRRAMVDMIVLCLLAVLVIFSVAQLRTAYLVNNPEVAIHDSATLMRAFALFNIMLFGCAAFLSRQRHKTGIELVHFAQKALDRCRARYHHLEKELSVQKQRRESLRVASETEAHRVTDQHLELCKLYHMYNRRVRSAQEQEGAFCPPYFETNKVNTNLLVSLPRHFAERILDEPAEKSPEQEGGSEETPRSLSVSAAQ